MVFQHHLQLIDILLLFHMLKQNHFKITTLDQLAVRIVHISDATRHPRTKVSARFAKNNNSATRHILTAMIAYSFNNDTYARVSHGKSFARYTEDVSFTARCSVEHRITRNDIAFSGKC